MDVRRTSVRRPSDVCWTFVGRPTDIRRTSVGQGGALRLLRESEYVGSWVCPCLGCAVTMVSQWAAWLTAPRASEDQFRDPPVAVTFNLDSGMTSEEQLGYELGTSWDKIHSENLVDVRTSTYVDVRRHTWTHVDVRGRTSTYVDVRPRKSTSVQGAWKLILFRVVAWV